VYTIASDGRLHALSMVDGEDIFAPLPFVPPFSKNWSLNLAGGVLYTAIGQRCNGVPSGVWSMDLNSPARTVRSFQAGPGGVWGRAGVAISSSVAVFGETGDGPYHPENGQYSDTILALTADLKLADYYTPANREWLTRKDLDMGAISPAVFPFEGRDYVAGSGKEGRLYLLDAASPGGADHRTPLYRSELVNNEDAAYAAHGFWGSFATWEDPQGGRWLFAPSWGPPHPKARPFPLTNGDRAERQYHGVPGGEERRRAGTGACLDLARFQRTRAAGHRQRRGVRTFERRRCPPGGRRRPRHEYRGAAARVHAGGAVRVALGKREGTVFERRQHRLVHALRRHRAFERPDLRYYL
jgi:hypothetical protein